MKVVALISGGKDSCFNAMQCIASGHEIVALANIAPSCKTEIDSFMYQSVGHEAIELIAKAMELPLFREETKGLSKYTEMNYTPTDNDEVEDLYLLLKRVQASLRVEAVSVGAVLSDYQRTRVENVCSRLGLVPLAYLWQRNQHELLQEMIKCDIDAIVIKVAALGLDPSRHLGRNLRLVEPHLHLMHEKFGLHVCGEGGEYETLVLDCPLYSSRIIVEESEVVLHSDNSIAPVGYLKLNKLKLEAKPHSLNLKTSLKNLPLKDSDGYITDYGEEAEDFFNYDMNDTDNLNGTSDRKTKINTDVLHYEQTVTCATNKNGWLWIGGLTGKDEHCGKALLQALEELKYKLEMHNHTLKDICSVSLYVSDISQFAELNEIYKRVLNNINPPTRACVEVTLPKDNPVMLEVVSWIPTNTESVDIEINRRTLYVQSVSHWAPVNIGPYSQAVRIGDLIYLAGIIGLVPGTLELVKGGFKHQCRLGLRHINRILAVMESTVNLRDVVQAMCYVTHVKYVESARKLWESKTKNAIVNYVVVSNLPKDALVEWHVWAHKYNNTFEYEETGRCVNDWSISIYRRSNFENIIACIVCIAENFKSDVALMPLDVFKDMMQYVLDKLQQGEESPFKSVCSLKIFYVTSKISSTSMLAEVINDLSKISPVVYTLVPVVSLHNRHSSMSISGMRM